MSSLPQTVGRATARALRHTASPGGRALSNPGTPSLIGTGLATLARALGHQEQPQRHPLQPAAVRFERTRARSGDHRGDQVAVTMWFGQGPALPSLSPSARAGKAAARMGGAVLLTAVAAAATTAVSRLQVAQRPQQIVDAPVPEPRHQ